MNPTTAVFEGAGGDARRRGGSAGHQSGLAAQGLATLSLRMDRHAHNALRPAEFLAQHPRVRWVNHPSLPSSPDRELAERYLPEGAGAVLTFGIEGGRDAGVRFIQACTLCSHLADVGDAKTLVMHPASTTHRRLDEEALEAAGVSEHMARISVGIETIDEISWDLGQALAATA